MRCRYIFLLDNKTKWSHLSTRLSTYLHLSASLPTCLSFTHGISRGWVVSVPAWWTGGPEFKTQRSWRFLSLPSGLRSPVGTLVTCTFFSSSFYSSFSILFSSFSSFATPISLLLRVLFLLIPLLLSYPSPLAPFCLSSLGLTPKDTPVVMSVWNQYKPSKVSAVATLMACILG